MRADDLIIIGAGPYGLSAAAHLRTVRGLQFRVFGEPMGFWEQHMPAGMFLRSSWEASHIADPGNQLTLEACAAARGNHIPNPIPIERFVGYGRWFQEQVAPKMERRRVERIEAASEGFKVTLEDGETLRCGRVVVAAGIAKFARRPAEFAALPAELATHTSEHTGFDRFSGKRVLVVGGGQSALESAALLHETGAEVEVVARQPRVHWLRWRARITRAGLIGRLIYSPRDVGPPGISQLVARPDYLKLLPRPWQEWIGKRSIRPAGAGWLMERLKAVSIRTETRVISATPATRQVKVCLADGKELMVDHIIYGTGYRIDVSKYGFFSDEILSRLETVNGYPRLRAGLESSINGLFFLGAPAAWSFGPVARFVSGAHYCVPALVKKVANGQA